MCKNTARPKNQAEYKADNRTKTIRTAADRMYEVVYGKQNVKVVEQMKKTEIKYVGWCHECKCLGSFICGNCKPNEKYSFARPSEFMPKDKKRWVRMEE